MKINDSLNEIIANLLREECRYDGDGYRFRRPSELAEKIIAAMERSSCGRAQIDKVEEIQSSGYSVEECDHDWHPVPVDGSSDAYCGKCGQGSPGNTDCSEMQLVIETDLRTQEAFSALNGYLQALEPGSVVTDRFIHRLMHHYLPNLKDSLTVMQLRPSPVPVSVSLEKISNVVAALYTNWETFTSQRPSPRETAKAVLDAAGVKYVD